MASSFENFSTTALHMARLPDTSWENGVAIGVPVSVVPYSKAPRPQEVMVQVRDRLAELERAATPA